MNNHIVILNNMRMSITFPIKRTISYQDINIVKKYIKLNRVFSHDSFFSKKVVNEKYNILKYALFIYVLIIEYNNIFLILNNKK